MELYGYGPNGYKIRLCMRDVFHAIVTLLMILGIVIYIHARDKVQRV